MCGRFNVTDSPAVHALLDDLGIDIGPLPTRYNVAPTEQTPVIYIDDGKPTLRDMRWWLVPSWSSGPSQKFAMFNARSETVHESRAFKQPFRRQRAVMLADSFIEWRREENGKQPFLISPDDGLFCFAAIWDRWQGEQEILSCSMITTEATESFRQLHHRQPVMLDDESLKIWLAPESSESDLTPLMMPRLPCSMTAVAVDRSTNSSRSKDPQIVTGEEELAFHPQVVN